MAVLAVLCAVALTGCVKADPEWRRNVSVRLGLDLGIYTLDIVIDTVMSLMSKDC